MPRLTDKQRKQLVADYIECQSYNAVGKKYKVSATTVKKWVLEDTDSVSKCEQKKEENINSILEYMDAQTENKKRILDKLLKAIEDKCGNIDAFTNVKDLATAYGIIVDKELKLKEIKNNSHDSKELSKVEELLQKIEDEAKNGIN